MHQNQAGLIQLKPALALWLVCLLGVHCGDAAITVDLGSQQWLMHNYNRTINATTTLPAYPLEVLRTQGLVDDPLHRYGELTSRWVALDNWTFSLEFSGSEPNMQQLMQSKQVLLQLGGVDTFAEVTMNGQHVLSTNNFHRHWTVPLKDLLQSATNTLQISIRPAMLETLKLKQQHAYNIPVIHQMGSVGAYNFVRKPASDHGWDWGPANAASGVHGGVKLLGFDHAHLAGAHVSQHKVQATYEVDVTSQLLVPPAGDRGMLTVTIPELNLQQTQHITLQGSSSSSSGSNPGGEPVEVKTSLSINASSVELWWPVGYGSPRLYTVNITYNPSLPQRNCDPSQTSPESTERQSQSDEQNSEAVPDTDRSERLSQSPLPPSPINSSPVPSAPSVAVAPVGNANKFIIITGLDLPGMAFDRKAVPDQASCQQWCRETNGCLFYTYAPAPESFCWLKSPVQSKDAVLGIKMRNSQYYFFAGYNLEGFNATDAPAPYVATQAVCRQLCSKRQDCNMFVYHQDNECQLKHAREAGPSRVLGFKLREPISGLESDADADSNLSDYSLAHLDSMLDALSPMHTLLPEGSRTASVLGKAAATTVALANYYDLDTFTSGAYGSAESVQHNDTNFQQQQEADCGDVGALSDHTSSLTYKIGFRTVELVRLPISEAIQDVFPPGESGWDTDSGYGVGETASEGSWAFSESKSRWDYFPSSSNQEDIEGESFYFKVNEMPVFIKGANLVPFSVLPTNVTKEMVHDVLQYALESNMNMIRVWGGGMYPVDEFFGFCDEKGLLVWMEAMFACSPYPRDPEFLDNVAAEVTQQAQRVSWHPSIAIWGGNNEIESSFNWYAESRSNRQLFASDYIALFIDTIRKALKQVAPRMAFVDSSPSNGVIADNNKQYIKRWGEEWDPRYGDVHYYAYDADCEDWSNYPKAKFISEFGSQSYPTFATYAEVTVPEDWQVDNQMTGFRNRRFGNGLEVFEKQFKRHFRLPDSWSAPDDQKQALKLFKSFLFITHMQQARCYETAINYWRRLRSQPAGLTMGVLYWQLNDIAPFASWSAYDHAGRWKPLAYAVKRIYAPFQVQAITDGNQTKIFLINDYIEPIAATITVHLLSLADSSDSCQAQSAAVLPMAVFNATVAGGFAARVWSKATAEVLQSRSECMPTTCYITVRATTNTAADGLSNSGIDIGPQQVEAQTSAFESETSLWFAPLKDIYLPDPNITLEGFAQVVSSTPETPAASMATALGVQEEGVNSADSFAATVAAAQRRRVQSTTATSNLAPPTAVTFTVTSTRPAALTSFSTQYKGRFSDDAFTALHPCHSKNVRFYPHASVGTVSTADLAAELQVESLFDHQF